MTRQTALSTVSRAALAHKVAACALGLCWHLYVPPLCVQLSVCLLHTSCPAVTHVTQGLGLGSHVHLLVICELAGAPPIVSGNPSLTGGTCLSMRVFCVLHTSVGEWSYPVYVVCRHKMRNRLCWACCHSRQAHVCHSASLEHVFCSGLLFQLFFIIRCFDCTWGLQCLASQRLG